jgi:hypothetical protein
MRQNCRGMSRSRIEIYWNTAETAPDRIIAQVRVADDGGPIIFYLPVRAYEGGVGQRCLRQAIGRARNVLEALCDDASQE